MPNGTEQESERRRLFPSRFLAVACDKKMLTRRNAFRIARCKDAYREYGMPSPKVGTLAVELELLEFEQAEAIEEKSRKNNDSNKKLPDPLEGRGLWWRVAQLRSRRNAAAGILIVASIALAWLFSSMHWTSAAIAASIGGTLYLAIGLIFPQAFTGTIAWGRVFAASALVVAPTSFIYGLYVANSLRGAVAKGGQEEIDGVISSLWAPLCLVMELGSAVSTRIGWGRASATDAGPLANLP